MPPPFVFCPLLSVIPVIEKLMLDATVKSELLLPPTIETLCPPASIAVGSVTRKGPLVSVIVQSVVNVMLPPALSASRKSASVQLPFCASAVNDKP